MYVNKYIYYVNKCIYLYLYVMCHKYNVNTQLNPNELNQQEALQRHFAVKKINTEKRRYNKPKGSIECEYCFQEFGGWNEIEIHWQTDQECQENQQWFMLQTGRYNE